MAQLPAFGLSEGNTWIRALHFLALKLMQGKGLQVTCSLFFLSFGFCDSLFFCWNFGECPIPAVLAVFPAPLQRGLGTFWSCVWCEKAPSGFLVSFPSIILPTQAMKSGFILQSLSVNIQDLQGKYSVFSKAGNPWQIQDFHYLENIGILS